MRAAVERTCVPGAARATLHSNRVTRFKRSLIHEGALKVASDAQQIVGRERR